jgi:hypothetical protein
MDVLLLLDEFGRYDPALPLDLLINFKSLDIDEPPRAHFVFDVVGDELPELNAEHPRKILDNVAAVVECLRQMPSLLCPHYHGVVVASPNDVLLDLGDGCVVRVELVAVCDYEAFAFAIGSEYRTADEGPAPTALYVALQNHEVVHLWRCVHLLQRFRVYQLDVVASHCFVSVCGLT